MNKKEALIACLKGEKIRHPQLPCEIYWKGSGFCLGRKYAIVSDLPNEDWEIVKEPRKEVVEVFVPKDWEPYVEGYGLDTFLFGHIEDWSTERDDVSTQKVRVTIEEIE